MLNDLLSTGAIGAVLLLALWALFTWGDKRRLAHENDELHETIGVLDEKLSEAGREIERLEDELDKRK